MAQELLVVVLPQDVEHEAVAHLHQGLDGPVLGHGHRESWGIEAGLAHPAGHHGGGALILPGCHHVEPAAEAAQGLVEVAIQRLHRRDGLLPREQLAQVGAGLLAALIVVAVGHLANA